MNICGLLLLIAGLMIGSGNLQHSFAQDNSIGFAQTDLNDETVPADRPEVGEDVFRSAEPTLSTPPTLATPDNSADAVIEFKVTDISIDRGQLQRRIQSAIQQLKQTPDEKKKQEIKAEMSQLFTRYFDYEIKQREVKLAPLENRVKKLKAQIDKRKAAKEKIIELQLQLMEHQAEGLGFFTEPNSAQIFIGSDAGLTPLPTRDTVRNGVVPTDSTYNDSGFNDPFIGNTTAKPTVNRRRSNNRIERNKESFDDFNDNEKSKATFDDFSVD